MLECIPGSIEFDIFEYVQAQPFYWCISVGFPHLIGYPSQIDCGITSA